jgi:hypothetical protein
LVAGQDVEPGDEPGTRRIAERTAPDRVVSTVDPESRHAHKTAHSYRDGFKATWPWSPTRAWQRTARSPPPLPPTPRRCPGLIDHEPKGT